MAAACKHHRRITGILEACALSLTVFFSQQAYAKDNSLKGQLEHGLVGQVVTSKILLGDRARPSDVAREGITLDFPVHTLVNGETGHVSYRVEDALWLEWAEVYPDDMVRSFGTGTSFRISAIRIKDDRIEIKLNHLEGGSAEVKLLLGKGWQSKSDAASVEEILARIFTFGQPVQREMEAEQPSPQENPVEAPTQLQVPAPQVETAAQPTTPAIPIAAAESPANRVFVPPNPPQQAEEREPTTPESARPAFINCNAVQQVALFSLPDASSSPVGTLQCGEKVVALCQQQDWVRVRTQHDVEGFAYGGYVSHGDFLSCEQASDVAVQRSPSTQTNEQPSPTQLPASGAVADTSGSWGWREYAAALLAACLVLCVIVFTVGMFSKRPASLLGLVLGVTGTGFKNFLLRLLAITLLGLSLGPIGYFATGSDGWCRWTQCMVGVTAIIVLLYAPVYAFVTFLPLVGLYINSPSIDTDGKKIAWGTFWLLVWSMYPLARGSLDATERREEIKKAEEESRRDREQREAERHKAEAEERKWQNQVNHERASAERGYGHVAARFADLVKTCGPQAVEMMRAAHALGGPDFEGKTAIDIATTEAMLILSIISKAEGKVPTGLAKLYQAIYGRLRPDRMISWEQHQCFIDDLRRESHTATLPVIVLSLHVYDQSQNTRMAAKAAECYLSLVQAACSVGDNQGVATKIVRQRYLQLLSPYLSGSGESGKGPQNRTGSDVDSNDSKSGFARCQKCPDYCAVLHVSASATREEIRAAYRDLAKIYHTDRLQSQAERVKRRADDLLKGVNEAYAHISEHWRS